METGFVTLVVLITAVFIVFMVVGAVAERRREQELAAWAQDEGWHYQHDRRDLVRRFKGEPFRGALSNAKAKNVLSGQHRGHQVMAYEYSYKTTSSAGTGSTITTHVFCVVAVATLTPTPVLQVKVKHLGHRLLDLLGVHDLEFDHEQFDSTFHVSTDDDRFARLALDAEVRAWLLPSSHRTVPFRFTGEHLVGWHDGKLRMNEALERADALVDLVERVPEQVWERPRD